MMADDEVFNHDLQLVREAWDFPNLLLQHLELDNHVSQQLSLGCVCDRALIGQLVNLADVMQESAGQQQIAIYLRIVAHREITNREQRHHVIQQSADVSVMQGLRGWSVLVGSSDSAISHKALKKV